MPASNPVRNTTRDTERVVPAQLPLWPEQLRGLPLAALRSALFAPVQRGQRAAMQRATIDSVGSFKIVYTGVTLDTGDLEVYEEILHRARRTLGRYTHFRTRELLQSIGRAAGKSQREWLLKSLSRLSACELEVSNGDKAYAGSLIQEQGRDDKAGSHYVMLTPAIAALFDQGYSVRNPEQLRALGNAQLAKWLLGFTANQAKPLTFNQDDLARYARSSYTRRRDFRRRLDLAAEQLRAVGRSITLDWNDKRNQVTIDPSRDRNAPQGA